MTNFVDLPNELVSKILWQAQPQDIESLTAISKHVYQLAGPLLQEHRKLKRQYTSLKPPPAGEGKDVGNWYAEQLINVLQNPRIAMYVTELWATYWHESWMRLYSTPDPEDISKYHLSYPNEMLEQLEHAVYMTDIIPPDQADDWIAQITAGDEDPITALLVLYLPNLQTLEYDLYCQPSQAKVRDVIQRIVQTKTRSYLSQLKQVTLDYGSKWMVKDNCDLLQAFMLLPSVQTIHVRSLGTTEAPPDLEIYDSEGSSKVSKLALSGSLHLTPLCRLFKKCACLKEFSLQNIIDPEDDIQVQVFDTPLLTNALLASASDTLQTLKLSILRYITKPLGSLHQFQILRELDVDVKLLFNEDGSDILTWPNRLPSSLEKLSLTIQGDHPIETPDNFCEAFRCFLRAKELQTPCLDEIFLRMQSSEHCRKAYDHVQNPCSCAGVLLQSAYPNGGEGMDAACRKCEDCRSVVDQFLQETGGPQSHDSYIKDPMCVRD